MITPRVCAFLFAGLAAGCVPPSSGNLEDVLGHTANVLRRSVSGQVWETYDLDAIEFPDEVLRYGTLHVGVGVVQYRPEGAPWAQYAVLFALIDAGEGGSI